MDKNSNKKEISKYEALNKNSEEWIEFPFQIGDVDTETNTKMLQDFTGERTGYVRIGPKQWLLPSSFKADAELYYNFQPRPTDVWIVTFPRSGTTWTQELVWLLANGLNYEVASQLHLGERFPFLEYHSCFHPILREELLKKNSSANSSTSSLIREMTSPKWENLARTQKRFIKTHLPLQLLPPNLLEVGCKIIYVARNPKDVAVSYYHFNRTLSMFGYLGNFSKFWNYFKNGHVLWAPYWFHIEEGWNHRNKENFLFLFYDDMTKDFKGSIKKVADFLGVKYSEQQYETLQEHLKIENFRNNKSVNHDKLLRDIGFFTDDEGFIRKGKTGGWRDYFTGVLNVEADKWIEDNMKKTGVQFPEY